MIISSRIDFEWILENAEALRLSGMLGVAGVKRLGPPNSVFESGVLKARLEPSGGFEEHITFQSNFVQLSSHRLQIEVDSQRELWEGFRPGRIPATNVKKISTTNPTADWASDMESSARLLRECRSPSKYPRHKQLSSLDSDI